MSVVCPITARIFWQQVRHSLCIYFNSFNKQSQSSQKEPVVDKSLSDKEISQQLNQFNSFYHKAFMKCLKSMKDESKQDLLEVNKVNIYSASLQDFDWQLKLAFL